MSKNEAARERAKRFFVEPKHMAFDCVEMNEVASTHEIEILDSCLSSLKHATPAE